MKDAATKKDVEDAIEDLAKMTKGSFDYMQEHTATKEDLKELRQELGEDMSRLEDKIDSKLDVLIERFDTVIENHEQRIGALERL